MIKKPVKSAPKPGSKWGSELSKFQSGWKESETQYDQMFGASELPEDVYVMQLQDAKLSKSDAGNISIRREHVILEGDHKGVVVRDGLQLGTEFGPVFVRQWLSMIGVEIPAEIGALEKALVEAKEMAPVCKGRVTHSGDFTNVRIISAGDEEGQAGEAQEVDVESMTLDELRTFVKENDLEIEGYRKMSEEDLKSAVTEAISGGDAEPATEGEPEGEPEGEVPDFSSMDKNDLFEFIKTNEVTAKDLGYKNDFLMKKAKEDELRDKLTELYGGTEGEGEGGGEDTSEQEEKAKKFCGTWGVEIPEGAGLDEIKSAISKCQFPEDETDPDEIALLNELGLESTIIKKAAPKKVFKKPVKK